MYNDDFIVEELKEKLASSNETVKSLTEWLEFIVKNVEFPESTLMQLNAEIRKSKVITEEEG